MIKQLAILLVLSVCAAGSHAQTLEQFRGKYREMLTQLRAAWADEFSIAAELAHPQLPRSIMKEFAFTEPTDPCSVKIGVMDVKQQKLPIALSLIAITSSYVLIPVLYLAGVDDFGEPAKFVPDLFARHEKLTHRFYNECLRGSLSGLNLNVSGEFFDSPKDYAERMQTYSQSPRVMETANILGGSPLMFVLFHEVGHVYLKHTIIDRDTNTEYEADEFARKVFRVGKIPELYGTFGLMAYYGMAPPNSFNRRELACRMLKISKESEVMDQPRLAKLQDALVEYFMTSCN